MMCFRDMTFCGSNCTNEACRRHYGEDEAAAARDWWNGMEGSPPIAWADFSGDCADYQPPKRAHT
jgi:hypothetical protein